MCPVSVVARAFEYNVAISFVVSKACGLDSHCVTGFIAYLCNVFFVRFLHNRSVLLINPGFCAKRRILIWFGKNEKKKVLKYEYL